MRHSRSSDSHRAEGSDWSAEREYVPLPDLAHAEMTRAKMPIVRFAHLVLAMLSAATPAASQTADQKEEIETIVRDYLLANPEIIEEAITILQENRAEEALSAEARAIESKKDLIFSSPHQMVLGNPAGAISLVEFFDYNCGYCRRAVSDMNALIDANPDLRVVMKEFPILSPGSIEAARISVAVKDTAPERYLEFHEAIFSRPGEANAAKALEIAAEIGLDRQSLITAANHESVTRNLQEVQELAETLGISGTPSYVIGSELVPGAAGFDALQAKVASMRDCGRTTC